MTVALRDAADSCLLMRRAVALAGWVGDGRILTPKGVLRPVDVAAAMAAMGLVAPARARTAADIVELHRPWTAAVAAGLVVVRAGRATTGSTPEEGLEAWFVALRAQGDSALCHAQLAVADGRSDLSDVVFDYAGRRATAMMQVLAEFGALDGGRGLTALGRWALERFDAIAPPVTAELSADELLVRLAGRSESEILEAGSFWLGGRDVGRAAAEVLAAAETASPAGRVAGVDLIGALGEAMLPAWRAVVSRPMLGPHARAALATYDGRDEAPSEVDHRWLAVEYALAAVDLEEAWYLVEDFGGLDVVTGSTHPSAGVLLRDLTAAGRPQPRTYQLKVVLRGMRSPVWRRLRVPGSLPLDALHYVLQAAFDWQDSHLHLFEVGGRRYSSSDLDDCEDESGVRVAKALPVDGLMTYVYDMGDWWEHRITVERVDEVDEEVVECSGGRGNAPVEDSESGTTPFDVAAINRRLGALFAQSDA